MVVALNPEVEQAWNAWTNVDRDHQWGCPVELDAWRAYEAAARKAGVSLLQKREQLVRQSCNCRRDA